MKLTTRARYGTRALLDLALRPRHLTQIKSVAERGGVSKKYLEQLLAPLKDAGVIHTLRGPHGGYQLARSPEKLGLGELLRILEGPLELVDCVGKEPCDCPRMETCAARKLWTSVAAAIERTLDQLTLADLVRSHLELAGVDSVEELELPVCDGASMVKD